MIDSLQAPLRLLCKPSSNPCRPREMLWSCNNEEPLCNLHITIGGINDPFREVRVLADSSTVGSGRREQETMIQDQPTLLTILSLHLYELSLQSYHYCVGIKITIWEFVNSNDELHYERRHLLKEQKSTSNDFRARNLSFLWLKKQECW